MPLSARKQTKVKEENIDTPITYFKYEVNSENEITITGLSEEGIAAINSGTTSFKIPSVIEEKTVTQIGAAAFSDAQLAGIVEILSSRVTTIGASIFNNNNNLKVKVDFASSSDSRPEGWDGDWSDRNLCYLYRCRN